MEKNANTTKDVCLGTFYISVLIYLIRACSPYILTCDSRIRGLSASDADSLSEPEIVEVELLGMTAEKRSWMLQQG